MSESVTQVDEFGLPIISDGEIQKAFNKIDADNSGFIENKELKEAFHSLGLVLSYPEYHDFMRACDVDHDGRINFQEFASFARQQDKKIRECFAHLDLDKDQKISSYELRRGLKQDLNIDISYDELRSFMQVINNNGNIDISSDNYIPYETFRNKLLLLPFVNTRAFYEYYRHNIYIDIGEDSSHSSLFIEISNKWRDKYNNLIQHDKTNNTQIFTGTNVFISGAISGAVSRTMTAPMDRMKVMFQSGFDANSHNTKVTAKKQSLFKQITGLTHQIYKEGGWKAFWRGNGTNCLKMAPEKAIKLQSYEMFKQVICEDIDNPTPRERFIAGGAAGLAAQTMIYPLEITKTRLALANVGQYKGILDCMKKIVRNDGILSMYNGWNASVLGIIPYAAIELSLYNTFKDKISEYKQQKYNTTNIKPPSALEILAAGSVASCAGQFVAYPLQVLRTKLQSQGQIMIVKLDNGTTMKIEGMKYKNIFDCAKHIMINEGISGFYRGIAVNFMKSIPATGLSFMVFEQSKQLVRDLGV